MHCPWTRKSRAWGYEVIRGIDEDDPLRVIQAFRRPTGLAFVDLNTQVEHDYGGYAWTQWMHQYFGDTALHIALKWKRHRTVKALLSLRPSWHIRNEDGVTAEQLVLQLYGKGMARFKDEQEREYESEAMRAEEEAMRNLMAAEQAARDKARQKFLAELQAARTVGITREAAILLEHGRVILANEAARNGETHRHPHAAPGPDVDPSTSGPNPSAGSGWVAYVCQELRRNRFATHRGAMRRNFLPARAPTPVPVAMDMSPLSPPPTAERVGSSQGNTATKDRKSMRSPTCARSVEASRRGRHRLAGKPDIAPSYAASSQGKKQEKDDLGRFPLFFDISSPVSSGRWPGADTKENSATTADRERSASPLRLVSVSPLGVRSVTLERGPGRNTLSSPGSIGGGASVRSGSTWGGGKTGVSPARSSRMSAIRTTRIIAAGKSLKRSTPEERLQQKMKARSAAARARSAPPPALLAATVATPPHTPLTDNPTRSQPLPAPATPVVKQNSAVGEVRSAREDEVKKAIIGGAWCQQGDAAQAVDGSLESDGALVTASDNEPRVGAIGATHRNGSDAKNGRGVSTRSGGNDAAVEDGRAEDERGRSPGTDSSSYHGETCRRKTDLPCQDPTAVTSPEDDGEDAKATDDEVDAQNLSEPCRRPIDDDQNRMLRQSTSGGGAEKELREVREGPLRDAMVALLTSTVMAEDGRRVLARSVPSISALHELKYCGPIDPPQAFALRGVVLARPGVLVLLSLAGKRVGDEGALALAPALAFVRSVDLRSNNIGDVGTIALASALRAAEAATTASLLGGDGAAGVTIKEKLCILETLSLAGNRIEDAGAAALSEMLEAAGQDETVPRETRHKHGSAPPATPDISSHQRLQSLSWLSVASNPGISEGARGRLLRAGLSRRAMRRRIRAESDPPSMVVIV